MKKLTSCRRPHYSTSSSPEGGPPTGAPSSAFGWWMEVHDSYCNTILWLKLRTELCACFGGWLIQLKNSCTMAEAAGLLCFDGSLNFGDGRESKCLARSDQYQDSNLLLAVHYSSSLSVQSAATATWTQTHTGTSRPGTATAFAFVAVTELYVVYKFSYREE